jgi:voltage-gated potassium channel
VRAGVTVGMLGAMRQDEPDAIDRLNRALDGPMTILSLVMVVIIVLQLVGEFRPPFDRWAEALGIGIWLLFVTEFGIKLWLAPNRRDYVSRNWLDVLILALPVLRGLRLLRVVRLARGYHGLRFAAWLFRSARDFHEVVRRNHLGYLLGLSAAVALAGAVMVWWLERGVPGATIRTFGDALWWSATLITTINASTDPVTLPGRLVALGIRLYGMSVFVFLVSSLTSFWFGRAAQSDLPAPAPDRDDERPAA